MYWIEALFKNIDANGKDITIKLSMPFYVSDMDAAACEVVFLNHESLKISSKTIYGINEFQVLILSYKFIRNEFSNFSSAFECNGLTPYEMFPLFIDPFLGKFSKAMENCVESRMQSFHTRRNRRLENGSSLKSYKKN